MKKLILTLTLLFLGFISYACPVCERNKTNALAKLGHGSGPDSNWDYIIVVVIGLIAVVTLIYSVMWIIKPGEKNADHIKYSILNN